MKLGILMAATATLGLLAESNGPKVIARWKERNEGRAAATLAAIASAQAAHLERRGRYGSLAELADEGLVEGVDRARSTLTADGFVFESAPGQDRGKEWQAIANPVRRGLTGDWSLAASHASPFPGRTHDELVLGKEPTNLVHEDLIDGVLGHGVKQGYVFTTTFASTTSGGDDLWRDCEGVIFYTATASFSPGTAGPLPVGK